MMRISTRTCFAALLALSLQAGAASAGEPVNTGLFGGVAIKGYDTVAYFTEGQAMKGSADGPGARA